VEYCWGNTSTTMGAQRESDGHPEPYRVKYFELGNEQYNNNYVEQVAAMEAKANELGMGEQLFYMFPSNSFLNKGDIAKASALKPRIDAQMVADLHVGGGGAVQAAKTLFASDTSFKMGAVNAETNAGTHTFSRAMSEAADLNDWFNADAETASRLHFRAASFCMGDSTDFDSWDQGISFFLPNMTWLQPPGYVHKMIAQSWQPNALAFTGANNTAFSAQSSEDGKSVVLRFVNSASQQQSATVTLQQDGAALGVSTSAQMVTMSSSDPGAANPPGDPTLVSPKSSSLPNFKSGSTIILEPSSYTVVTLSL